jgi:hypothetical protein
MKVAFRMRRLVLELYGKELNRRIEGTTFRKIKSMELLHLLRYDKNEFTGIFRIALMDSKLNVERLFDDDETPTELKLLEFKGGAFTVFLKRRPRPGYLFGTDITRTGSGYIISPFEIGDGKIKFAFVGNQKQVGEIIAGVEKRGLDYKIISLTDADFPPNSPLNCLTQKQRDILVSAFKLGYYDVPRKINSNVLADHLGLKSATVVEHLRKAEKRLISAILNES